MNETPIIRMANQIGDYFQYLPDRGEAIEGIVDHIRKTWESRMIIAFKHHLATCGDRELSEILREAAPRIVALAES